MKTRSVFLSFKQSIGARTTLFQSNTQNSTEFSRKRILKGQAGRGEGDLGVGDGDDDDGDGSGSLIVEELLTSFFSLRVMRFC